MNIISAIQGEDYMHVFDHETLQIEIVQNYTSLKTKKLAIDHFLTLRVILAHFIK